MARSHRIRHHTAWLACLALVFAALLPYVQFAQRAATGADGFPRAAICTPSGVQYLDGSAPHLPSGHGHCALCWAPSATGTLPSMPLVAAPVRVTRTGTAQTAHAVDPAPPWSPTQPRAPPASVLHHV